MTAARDTTSASASGTRVFGLPRIGASAPSPWGRSGSATPSSWIEGHGPFPRGTRRLLPHPARHPHAQPRQRHCRRRPFPWPSRLRRHRPATPPSVCARAGRNRAGPAGGPCSGPSDRGQQTGRRAATFCPGRSIVPRRRTPRDQLPCLRVIGAPTVPLLVQDAGGSHPTWCTACYVSEMGFYELHHL